MTSIATSSFLCDIGEPRFRQNNTRYQIIKIVKYELIPYLKIWYPVLFCRLPNIAQKTACTQNVPMNISFQLITSSLLCNIGEPRYRQNNTWYHISRIWYVSIFDYHDNPIPYIVLPLYRLPDVTQKTTCTQNVALDVTFHLRYVSAFNNVYILSNPWKTAKILFMRFFKHPVFKSFLMALVCIPEVLTHLLTPILP